MQMSQILQNTDLQSQLDRDGYLLIDFIDPNLVSRLKLFYEQGLLENDDSGFRVGLDHPDKALVEETTQFLIEMLQSTAEAVFNNPKIFTASYVVKHPGSQTTVPPHQDWTFTDETQFATYTVWIPLVDTSVENGALCVIPGSHRFFEHPRSSPSPESKSAIADHLFTLFPYAKPIPMRAGQALIFNNRTIHASPPNLTDKPRIAVGIGVTSKAAPLRHFYQLPIAPDKLKEYEVDEAFFIKFDNQSLSELYNAGGEIEGYKELRIVEKNTPDLSGVEMESLVRSVEGNIWQDEMIAAVESMKDLYQSPKTMNTEPEEKIPEEVQNQQEQPAQQESQPQNEWVDNRTFFQKYTIPNIIAEIRWRLTGKS